MGRFELVRITLSVIVMLCVSLSSWVGVGEGAASTACDGTPYPQLCTQILQTNPSTMASTNPPPLQLQVSAMAAYALALTKISYQEAAVSGSSSSSLDDCIDLLRDSMDQLSLAISRCAALVDVGAETQSLRRRHIMDIQVALSQAFTMQGTCSDGLDQAPDSELSAFKSSTTTMALIITRSTEIGHVEDVALSLADTLRQTAP